MDELADLRQRHPLWRIWAGDGEWKYATRAGLAAPGTGVTVHGKTPQALADAIQQAETDAAKREGRYRRAADTQGLR